MRCTQRIYGEHEAIDVQVPTTIIAQPNHAKTNMIPISNSKIEVSVEVLRSVSLVVAGCPGREGTSYLTCVAVLTNVAPDVPVAQITLAHQTVELTRGRSLTVLVIGETGMIVKCYHLQGVIDDKVVLRSYQSNLIIGATFGNGFILKQSDGLNTSEASVKASVCPREGTTAFVVWIDPFQDYQWMVQMSSPAFSSLGDLQLDELGNIYLTGKYAAQQPEEISLRPVTSPVPNDADVQLIGGGGGLMTFLAMLNKSGGPVWITRIGPIPTPVSSITTGEVIQVQGGIITLVGMSDALALRFYQTPNATLLTDLAIANKSGGNRSQIFLTKYTTQGVPILARKIGGDLITSGSPLSMVVGKKDQIFLSGSCGEYLYLDGYDLVPPSVFRDVPISWVVKLNTLGDPKWVVWVTGVITSMAISLNVLQIAGNSFPRQATVSFFDSQLRRRQTIARASVLSTLSYLSEYRTNGQYLRTSKQTSAGSLIATQIAASPSSDNPRGPLVLASTRQAPERPDVPSGMLRYEIFSSDGQLACTEELTNRTTIYLTTMGLVSQIIDLPALIYGTCCFRKTLILESVGSSQESIGTLTMIRAERTKILEEGNDLERLFLNQPVVIDLCWNGSAWQVVARR